VLQRLGEQHRDSREVWVWAQSDTDEVARVVQEWRRPTNPITKGRTTGNKLLKGSWTFALLAPSPLTAAADTAALLMSGQPGAVLLPADHLLSVVDNGRGDPEPGLVRRLKAASVLSFPRVNQVWVVQGATFDNRGLPLRGSIHGDSGDDVAAYVQHAIAEANRRDEDCVGDDNGNDGTFDDEDCDDDDEDDDTFDDDACFDDEDGDAFDDGACDDDEDCYDGGDVDDGACDDGDDGDRVDDGNCDGATYGHCRRGRGLRPGFGARAGFKARRRARASSQDACLGAAAGVATATGIDEGKTNRLAGARSSQAAPTWRRTTVVRTMRRKVARSTTRLGPRRVIHVALEQLGPTTTWPEQQSEDDCPRAFRMVRQSDGMLMYAKPGEVPRTVVPEANLSSFATWRWVIIRPRPKGM
jgi:hypothetical protein